MDILDTVAFVANEVLVWICDGVIACSLIIAEHFAQQTVLVEGFKGVVDRGQRDRGLFFANFQIDVFCGEMALAGQQGAIHSDALDSDF